MATVKGQHLRVFVDDLCIAAASSCTLHVAMQTEDSSTKDDDSDFAKVNPTGLAWDVQADALVTDNNHEAGELPCDQALSGVTGFTYFSQSPINLKAGDVLAVARKDTAGNYKIAVLDGSHTILASANSGADIFYTAAANATVYLAASTSGKTLVYSVEDEAQNANTLLENIGQNVSLKFSYTTGVRNREESQAWLEGTATVSDWSLTATNRQNAVYSVSFTGNGELAFAE